jgi:hypothetical protein
VEDGVQAVKRGGWRWAGALVGATALLAPASASAHGLIQRADLPIPEWLFGWAAAIVLVVSFAALAALWPTPRLERVVWRPMPGGRRIGSAPVQVAGGVIGVLLLGVVVWAGFEGAQNPLENFAPTFVLIIFWVGLVFASLLFGDVFRALNPWRAIGRVLERVLPVTPRAYPAALGRWPAAAGLLIFTWIELASGWGEDPRSLATATLVYTLVTLAAQVVYGVETWTRNGEAFSVYFNLFSRMSVFETRGGVVGLRPFLGGLPKLDPLPGTVAVVAVMIGSVTFDGFSQGVLWQRHLGVTLNDVAGSAKLADTIGLLLGVALVAGFYHLGIAGARTVGGNYDAPRLRRAFIHTLVPIALVYAMAHYLTYLLFQGQAIAFLASDPLGRGWDLLGSASSGVDYSILSQNAVWYFQVGFVVFGHVAALVLAHDRALSLYGQATRAVRSQYWMLGIMVGFTTLALWLLAQANK